ncbi:sn-glycerol-3-phosphate ABC transporter ATP-binding protein UgpC [Pyxidicoccus fallax]|uniref:sn-glycerol-3-phosphate ABC transporter ATP-binding protein UgpC n=1 Tax=Pyxidicoccus fallax TaxID=394095 RepID=A0A848LJ68_9BACT|nr:sn-glycerol-3-phosphate ABC transporter ATP-binding protein UgpC [Pyxidicoccus fallax]NMO17785.1 sn-glycerol-3-phosphate ABC transporter ATP-binding protein UgpC [Pyxidicoccus fallax]NPC80111.1 sn-glycerol-3-phosphate ABC transporter ATP-binding protein UgpC [Pyxidicoccus fallax]
MADVLLRDVRKRYGAQEVIHGVSLELKHREFIVFVGPSGCGKSTLLRMIAGLEQISDGEILIGGRRVNDTPPGDRGVAMVFQNYALYPHMTAADNMSFGLRNIGTPRAEIEERVAAAARTLQIEHLLKRRPSEMSGGQRQRIAIGRAIVRRPNVFLFDEPLSNLDAALRVQMRVELVQLHQRLDATSIYVTHDQVEAMTMADRIVVFRDGRIEQVGTPLEVYRTPANTFVAGFIGAPKMNLLETRVTAASTGRVEVALPGGRAELAVDGRALASGASVTFGVRPEHLRRTAGEGVFRGQVKALERLGRETLLHVTGTDGASLIATDTGDSPVRIGDTVALALEPGSGRLFGGNGAALPPAAASAA